MILECLQNFTGNGSLITSDNKLSSDYKADIKDVFSGGAGSGGFVYFHNTTFTPSFLAHHPASPEQQHSAHSASHRCPISLIYSYSLSIFFLFGNLQTEYSAVAPVHLSHSLSFLEPVVLRQQTLEMLS